MKARIFSSIFILLLTIGVTFSQNFEEKYIQEIASMESKSFSNFRFEESTIGNNFDLKFQRLSWEINPEVYYIKGSVTSYFTITADNTNSIDFDLSDSLKVDSIIFRQSPINFSHKNHVLTIGLTTTLSKGTFDSLSIYYQGEPEKNNRSFVQNMQSDSITPVIYTLSQPYGSKDWWPCKQNLNDKIDSVDIIVETPSQYKVASNGLLIGEISKNNKKIYHWKHRYPIAAYLVGVAVTDYAVFSDYVLSGNKNLEIQNFVYPSFLEEARVQAKYTINVMRLFDSLTIPYPFNNEKYGHAQWGWGGGMEHQTMSFMKNYHPELVAHELAHQWFGNLVTCSSWKDIWLNEGITTYFTGLTYEFIHSPALWIDWKKKVIERITSIDGGSVYVYDTTNIGRIFDSRLTYFKGAMVMNMLRLVVGDTIFFQALRNFLNDPALKFNYASTENLKFHFEKLSGKDLNSFLRDWIYLEGFPQYKVEWNQNNNELLLKIYQTPSSNTVTFFDNPIPIRLKNDLKDTTFIIYPTFSGETFKLNAGFIIDSVFLDPERWIITKNPIIERNSFLNISNNLLENNIILFPNPVIDNLNISQLVSFDNSPNGDNLLIHPASIKIFNNLGQLVFSQSMLINKNSFIDLSSLSPGNYSMEINNSFSLIRKNIIKI